MKDRKVSKVALLAGLSLLVASLIAGAGAGEPASPARPCATSEEEKAKLLAAETAEQKKLRAELAALQGQKIYFDTTSADGRRDVCSIAPDGTGLVKLSQDFPASAGYPHRSPDGKKIAFATDRKMTREELAKLPCDPAYPLSDWTKRGNPKSTVWTMNADGSGAEPVAMGGDPHWSPDGKYLAYRTEPTPNKRMMCLLDLEKKREWVFKCVGGFTPTFTADSKFYLCGGPRIGVYKVEDIVGGNAAPTPVAKMGSPGCNAEVSRDGKVLVHVLDDKDGSSFAWWPVDFEKGSGGSRPVNLGWPKGTTNYYPEFSPDGKYLVYAHWETKDTPEARAAGRGPYWYNTDNADLYVCRWPADGMNVRVTWNGGNTGQPHWWGPAAAKGENLKETGR